MNIIWTIFFIVLAFYIIVSAIEKIYFKKKRKKDNGRTIDTNNDTNVGNNDSNRTSERGTDN